MREKPRLPMSQNFSLFGLTLSGTYATRKHIPMPTIVAFSRKINLFFILSLVVGLLAVSCAKEGQNNQVEPLSTEFAAKTDTVVMATFKALSSALQQAMKEGGVKNAVDFCQVEAIPITDSLSIRMGAKVARVSDKARNPLNKASIFETQLIGEYSEQIKQNGASASLLATMHKNNEGESSSVSVYKPIIIKGQCLNCHGKVGNALTDENYAFIKQFYPKDEAVGYEEGDVRGLWKVTFAK